MKRILSASAVCALAIGLVVVPGVAAKKGPKNVGGTVTVAVTPTAITTETSVTASGRGASNSGCKKDRPIHFAYGGSLGAGTPPTESATTKGNGDYSATLPKPTAAGTYTVRATVDA